MDRPHDHDGCGLCHVMLPRGQDAVTVKAIMQRARLSTLVSVAGQASKMVSIQNGDAVLGGQSARSANRAAPETYDDMREAHRRQLRRFVCERAASGECSSVEILCHLRVAADVSLSRTTSPKATAAWTELSDLISRESYRLLDPILGDSLRCESELH